MVEKLHSSHIGVENSIRNASFTLFWPLIRVDIKVACEYCLVFEEYAVQHQEPMLSHPVPYLPWQYISQDILKNSSRYYLVTVDHYRDFFEFDLLPDLQSSCVIEATKLLFACCWSPTSCLTNKGPQFIYRGIYII